MVYIYYTQISADFQDNLFDDYLRTLPVNMQSKIKSYMRWEDQQATLLGKLLVLKGFHELNLKVDLLQKIKYTSYGKPFLKGKIDFNISHSGNYVVCAISKTNRVGIDIEKIRDLNPLDFKSQMTNEEWKEIETSENKTINFFEYWTRKEAIVKAVGKGLSIPFKSFVINHNKSEINNKVWYLMKLDIDKNYRCYLALNQKQTKNVICQKIKF